MRYCTASFTVLCNGSSADDPPTSIRNSPAGLDHLSVSAE
jgi:hypothetical protein